MRHTGMVLHRMVLSRPKSAGIAAYHHIQTYFRPCIERITDLYKYSPDVVPLIHAVSSHLATDKPSSKDGGKFRSIFSDNLQPIETRGKKARGTLLADQHCGNGCSIKRAPLSVSCNEISGGHIWRGVVRRRCFASLVLPLWKARTEEL